MHLATIFKKPFPQRNELVQLFYPSHYPELPKRARFCGHGFAKCEKVNEDGSIRNRIMQMIKASDHLLTMKELSIELDINQTTVTNNVTDMGKAGLVRVYDVRPKLVSLI